ncbi:PKD domain-containing protein [Puia sp.]|uniref:PKD domain-containing protein n=1 Tax=Puia sp. TaxID=2045100 RepID=UPI002F42605E
MKARTLHLISALLTFLCLFSTPSFSQTPKYFIGPGEYNCFIINNATHKLYDVAGGPAALVPGQPSVVTNVAGALHHQCLLDDQGNVYCWGDNAYGEVGNGSIGGSVGSPVKISADSLGNAFNNIVQVCPGAGASGYLTMALKGDGTVWMWGATGSGNRGNGTGGGTSTRPVQIPFPAGVVIKKIAMDIFGCALDADGNVWTWGGAVGYSMPYLLAQGKSNPNPTTPTKINISSPVVDIQAGSNFNYALCANGNLWGWGYYPNLMGMGATANAQLQPTLLNSYLNLPKPIKQISINNESSFVLLTDSTIWAWGDNACGSIGNGQELNWATYIKAGGQAAPYAWDWGMAELLVPKPQQIAVGLHSFTNVWNGLGDVFYTWAEDANGNLYSWGRNKGGVLGNGQMQATGDILSIYPNSFDVPWVTAINPFALTKAALTSSPYCVLNPGGSPCSQYAIPNVANPTTNAGTNQNISTNTTTLTGSATTANSNTYINYYLWTQVSGPSTSLITLPSGPTAKVSNLITGTYVYQLKVTDNNWRTATSQVTVVVNSSGTNKPPVAKANSKITITLPTSTATLDGSASTDPDGAVTGYAWQQSSGPNSATIASPTAATTGLSGLAAGTYIFSLTVTDNQGATNMAADTVVVNSAALPNTPPTVTAGSDKTITLPIATVTLTGTATGTNGATIASTSWSQASGPAPATIVSVGNLITVVNALVQGTYTFRLSATDNNGQTASSTVKVTVNATAPAPPPTVDAGTTQTITLPTNSVTLAGTASGNSGATISSTQWTQTSGPANATIGVAGSLSTSASNLVEGTYTFTLRATDSKGQTASANVTVTVNAAALVPPTVSAGSDKTITLPTNTTTLTGTATANGGATISSTTWTEKSGPATATIGTASNLTTTISDLVQGTYTFTLSATDSKGQTTKSTVTVTVNGAPAVPPTVSAGSTQTITLPTNQVTLTGTATANGGATISSTYWTETSGPSAATIGTASSLTTTVSNLLQGTYTFLLTATDNRGQATTASVTVTVNSSAPPPTYTPPTVNAGGAQTITLPVSSATLTGTASANGGATLTTTKWTQIGGPSNATFSGGGTSLTTTVSSLVQGVYVFLLSATDNNGQTSGAYVTVTVNGVPVTPPTVDAGTTQTLNLPTSSTTLTGVAAATGGASLVSTQWTQLSGPGTATIATPGSLTTAVRNLVEGIYVFLLTAKDNNGQTASDYVQIYVNGVKPTPPTVSAGTAQTITLPTNSTMLTGTAAGTGSATIAITQWSQIGGPSNATIGSPGQLSTNISNLVEGVYVFLLTAQDNNAQTASAYVTVSVNAASQPVTAPNVSATAQSITLPVTQSTLTGMASGTNGATIASTQWSQVSGPTTANLRSAGSLTTSVTNLIASGTYTFQLTVTDNHGQIASTTVNLVVSPQPPPPVVNAGSDKTITLPTSSLTLTGSATGVNGATIVSTTWSQESGPATATLATPNAISTGVSGLTAGQYVFMLTATDSKGQSASSTVNVNVYTPPVNIPPVANAGSDQTFTLTGSDTTITLDGSASFDPDGEIVSYSWYQLSGKGGVTITNANTPRPTIHGLQAGVYVFVFVVADNRGATTQTQLTITINQPNAPNTHVSTLIANAGKDTTIALPASAVQLNGSGSSDGGGAIASYHWEQMSGPEGMSFTTTDGAITQADNLVAGLYQFRLTVTSQSGDTASAIVKVTVMSDTRGSKDSSEAHFFLYPNPAHDQTTLNMTGDGQGLVVLNLFDMNGKFVKALQFSKAPGTSSVLIDVTRLTAGMYIIRATYGNNQTQQIKLMKQ